MMWVMGQCDDVGDGTVMMWDSDDVGDGTV